MRTDALRAVPDAYPRALAAAFRIASGWTNQEQSGTQPAKHADPDATATAFVAKASAAGDKTKSL